VPCYVILRLYMYAYAKLFCVVLHMHACMYVCVCMHVCKYVCICVLCMHTYMDTLMPQYLQYTRMHKHMRGMRETRA
jgi:hypothetical protein